MVDALERKPSFLVRYICEHVQEWSKYGSSLPDALLEFERTDDPYLPREATTDRGVRVGVDSRPVGPSLISSRQDHHVVMGRYVSRRTLGVRNERASFGWQES